MQEGAQAVRVASVMCTYHVVDNLISNKEMKEMILSTTCYNTSRMRLELPMRLPARLGLGYSTIYHRQPSTPTSSGYNINIDSKLAVPTAMKAMDSDSL